MNNNVDQLAGSGGKKRRLSTQNLLLAVIVLMAAVLRLWDLESSPPGLHHDEAYNGLDALAVNRDEAFPIYHEGWELYQSEVHGGRPIRETQTPVFFEGNFGREPLYIYLAAASLSLFGDSMTSLRFVSALLGAAAVLATFLAAQALLWPRGDEKAKAAFLDDWPHQFGPLIAAFFMAILFPTIHFSRIGLRTIAYVPLEVLAVYFLWRGIRSVEKPGVIQIHDRDIDVSPTLVRSVKFGWFAAAGVFMGLGVYSYAAARFMPLLIIAFFFIWWLQDRDVLRRYLVNLLILAAAAIITAGPLLLYLIRQPYYLVYRSRFVGNRGTGTYPGRPWITWILNTGRVAKGLVWQGDQNIVNNLPGRPFLDPIQSVLAFLGVLSMVWRKPRISDQFLIIWLLVMLMPGVFSGDAPHFGRLIGAAAPLSIIMAKGCIWLVQSIQKLNFGSGRVRKYGPFLVLTILLIVSLGLTSFDYFYRYQQHSDLLDAFDNPDWRLGQFAASLPEEASVYLTPTQEEMATIIFAFGGQARRLNSFFSPQNSLLPAGVSGKPAYYLVRSPADSTAARITQDLAGTYVESGNLDFSVLVVAGDTNRTYRLDQEDISWGGAIVLKDWQADQIEDQLEVTLTMQAQVPMNRAYTIFVHLLDGNGELIAQLDRLPDGYPTSDWKEGEIVIDRLQLDLPPAMEAGRYFLQSGFYYLPTEERLGEPQFLGEVDIK